MRVHRRATIGTFLSLLGVIPCVLSAQTATQTVTFSVVSNTRVAIGSVTAPLRSASISADGTRTSATVAGSSYAIMTNEKNQKIVASIDGALPADVSLAVSLGAPRGASTSGVTLLGRTATDVVTGITGADGGALPMSYRWNGASASVGALRNRIVTYTITAGL